MLSRIHTTALLFVTTLVFFCAMSGSVYAYEIVQTGLTQNGDFALDQAKVEVSMHPGDIRHAQLVFTNRTQQKRTFILEREDTRGSQDGSEPVVLLGSETGPYSGKDLLYPEVSTFELDAGERIALDVTIVVPRNAEPGGRYTSLIFSNKNSGTGGGATVISRVASLFFIDIEGDEPLRRDGELLAFGWKGFGAFFAHDSPLTFTIFYKNSGNVHLNLSGSIAITNIFGSLVDTIEIKKYYAMPDSIRTRDISWAPQSSIGIYKAILTLDRGYEARKDVADAWVFVITPVALVYLCAALGIMLILFLLRGRITITVSRKR